LYQWAQIVGHVSEVLGSPAACPDDGDVYPVRH
jgi:hypothetical protein